jgi:hypothetical protein
MTTTETTDQTTDQTTEATVEPEPREVVPTDGVWAVIHLMGRKTIAGRVSRDELLGGGTVLVETPALDGVTLVRRQSFNPASSLYLAEYCSRAEVLARLYPPVNTQLALTRADEADASYDDAYDDGYDGDGWPQ